MQPTVSIFLKFSTLAIDSYTKGAKMTQPVTINHPNPADLASQGMSMTNCHLWTLKCLLPDLLLGIYWWSSRIRLVCLQRVMSLISRQSSHRQIDVSLSSASSLWYLYTRYHLPNHVSTCPDKRQWRIYPATILSPTWTHMLWSSCPYYLQMNR